MTIGLDKNQLDTIFNETYRKRSVELRLDIVRMTNDFIRMGLSEESAKFQALWQARWEATGQAFVAALVANNSQIEKDLESFRKSQ